METSPYLQQHATNPVDWYAWGAEAIQRARLEDKPILVSIGYSTCHWCHVMEHESFCEDATAQIMNENFICIKVDREERPDIDKIYMTALQMMTGSGGWPLNVFLTPDLKPFFGGTYFAPKPMHGRASWTELLNRIAQIWKNDRAKILESADDLELHLTAALNNDHKPQDFDPSILDTIFKTLQNNEAVYGGFSQAPKFPMFVLHKFLLDYAALRKEKNALELSLRTLRAMASGGIYDQLGGGFHRYSTDDFWHVPHFEKMLYDNAQAASIYLQAGKQSSDYSLTKIGLETLDYMMRDLSIPGQAFFSAEDADSFANTQSSKKVEGAFYVWSSAELKQLLGQNEKIVSDYFGVQNGGNARQDPFGEFDGKNILFAAKDYQSLDPENQNILRDAKKILFNARTQKPRPHRDEKIVSGWNGLSIAALAQAYALSGEEKYLVKAIEAADFIQKNLWNPEKNQLMRSWCQQKTSGAAIAEDYAFMTHGLLQLYFVTFNTTHLTWAKNLNDALQQHFFDAQNGSYFMTAAAQDPYINLRAKEDNDHVEPSCVSIATHNLLCLAALLNNPEYRKLAEKNLRACSNVLQNHPRSLPVLALNIDFFNGQYTEIVIYAKNKNDAANLLNTAKQSCIANKLTIGIFSDNDLIWWQKFRPEFSLFNTKAQTPLAQVCRDQSCQAPTNDVNTLQNLLS